MNFGNIFKSISNFQFPYSLEEVPVHETALWQVFHGTRKSDSLAVTAFKAKRIPGSETLIANAIQKAKTLRIPGLCSVLDTFDSDPQSTFIVTERVDAFPWEDLPRLSRNTLGLQLGIFEILSTLNLLSSFVLGTISKGSLYINSKGQWMIFGLELCCNTKDSPDLFARQLKLYNSITGQPHSTEDIQKIDAMNLGLLIENLLGNKVPTDWKKNLSSLTTGMLSASAFLNRVENSPSVKKNQLIGLYKQLVELHIKDPKDKMLIMLNMAEMFQADKTIFQNLTAGFVENWLIKELSDTILWLVTTATKQANTNGLVDKIIPLLAIDLHLSKQTESFPDFLKNIIFECFKLPDRQIRFLLLIFLNDIVVHLTKEDISSKIYPSFVQGLADSDATLRLQTLKSLPSIVGEITERQLNNELLRYLAKTQVDTNLEVRTWTILVISKISSILSTTAGNRANILATAFSKSLRDPDRKPRLAALYGLENSIDLLDVSTIANKMLSVIAPGLLDKDQMVRSKAKNLFQSYLTKLESEAASLSSDSSSETHEDFDFDAYGQEDILLVDQFMDNITIPNVSQELVPEDKTEVWDKMASVDAIDNDWGDDNAFWDDDESSSNEINELTKSSTDLSLEDQAPVINTNSTTNPYRQGNKRSVMNRSSSSILTPHNSNGGQVNGTRRTVHKAARVRKDIIPEPSIDDDFDAAW